MGLWDITLDKGKANFIDGYAYAKSHSLYWHPSGDFYPYPTKAWHLDPVPDPDQFNVNLSWSPEAMFGEVKGDLEQLKARGVSNPIWSPATGGYFSAKQTDDGSNGPIADTQKCRELFVAGALDLDGYRTCLARVAADHDVG